MVAQDCEKGIRSRPLIDKVIIFLACTSTVILLVDRMFFASGGSFLVKFTWWGERGVILYATALALYALRRVFLKA